MESRQRGDSLCVAGRQHRGYQEKEYQERAVAELVRDDIQFLTRRTTGI